MTLWFGIGAGAGFIVGFVGALVAAWWGFRRGVEVKHPELLKKKPIGEARVEVTDFSPTAR